jgi:uridylate kinase
MRSIKVISLGGSLIAPDKVDRDFLKEFYSLIVQYFNEDSQRKIILVCGGGGTTREYQNAFREITGKKIPDAEDWIGIAATRLNAELLKFIFSGYCSNDVVDDPSVVPVFRGNILIASGWKPGFSTDFDAVLLAEQFFVNEVINLSNISQVYTSDPKIHSDAVPIDRITWKEFRKIMGDAWIPGMNLPFDPVASKKAAELGLRVIIASGKDTENIRKILYNKEFKGTVIE